MPKQDRTVLARAVTATLQEPTTPIMANSHDRSYRDRVQSAELVGLPRSTWYYEPAGESPENLALMRRINELYLKWPFYGIRKISNALNVNRKRIGRLMRIMGIEVIYPKPRTTRRGKGHKIYPYLLRSVAITRRDQVWSTDITYVPMQHGYLYIWRP